MTTLVVVPCGAAKVWDRDPNAGPVPARRAYTGGLFKSHVRYAEKFGDCWVILSAKYGFIDPDFLILGPYDVSFNKPSDEAVPNYVLKAQACHQMGLLDFDRVVGLGGFEYRSRVEEVFCGRGPKVEFPFAGLPIGKMLRAVTRAVQG